MVTLSINGYTSAYMVYQTLTLTVTKTITKTAHDVMTILGFGYTRIYCSGFNIRVGVGDIIN